MRTALYTLAQTVWGFPQTLIGSAVFAAHRARPHFRYHGAIVTTWESRRALSLGLFVFLPGAGYPEPSDVSADEHDWVLASVDHRLLVHEYGHTIQSLILGPLYLPVIGIPSVVWFNNPALAGKRRRENLSYYAFYTERWANHLGELVLKQPSMGMTLID